MTTSGTIRTGLRVTVVDQDDHEETVEVPEGDYLLICAEPCYMAHVQAFKNRTHVVTIKGRTRR